MAGAIRRQARPKATPSPPRTSPPTTALLRDFPNTLVHTSGPYVGLPDGQMGNSEVGHLNIGAGRVIHMDVTRIDHMIAYGRVLQRPHAAEAAMTHARTPPPAPDGLAAATAACTRMNTHLYALLEMAKREGVTDVAIHCFMDGRDTPPESGAGYLEELQREIRAHRRGPHRHGRRALLRHGPRQALGAHRAGLHRHGGSASARRPPIRWRPIQALLREGRDRRVHRAGDDRQRTKRTHRRSFATRTPASSSIIAPTAAAR